MKKPVKVLFVEDSEDDEKLALRALRLGGFEPAHRRVQTAADLEVALAGEHWDAVISDFSMPGFTGLDALRIFRSSGLDVPFILVSGTIGEEFAAEAMKAGASDYVMKRNLARLAPALERELKESESRAHLRVTQEALADSEKQFRQIAENIRDVFFLIDAASNRVLYATPAYEELWGRSREELYARAESWTEATHPNDKASLDEKYRKEAFSGTFRHEYRIVRPDGSIRCLETRTFPVRDAAGDIVRLAGISIDITERMNSDERIRRLNRVYAMLSGINALIVRAGERDDLFRQACRIAVDQGGFSMAWMGVVDRLERTVVHAASAGITDEFLAVIQERFSRSEDRLAGDSLAARAIRDKKATFSNDVQNAPVFGFKAELAQLGSHSVVVLPLQIADEVVGVFALSAEEADFFDADELKLLMQLAGDIAFAIDHIAKRERLEYLAYYDVLTGLANRSLFLERVAQYMRSAASGGHKLAVFFIDLERFKNINESLGRAAGDALLRQVADWLTAGGGDSGLMARVGADHFAVVMPVVRDEVDAVRFLEKQIEAFVAHPFHLNDAVFRIAMKVGVALFPGDGEDADTLLRNAEAALKKAKERGERHVFYQQKMTESGAGRLTLENKLRMALAKEQFVLHYQPKIELKSGKLTGAEALIRWNDPDSGLVPPMHFIPILEETGLIHDVGRWALRRALTEYLRWRAAGLPAVRIAVNVSPLQLRSRGFIAEIEQVIGAGAHAADGLELEITESLIMEDVKHSIATLKAVRAMGVTIAIDDFGTGFSSLSYLAKLPVDTLKIDRSFVIEMTAGPEGLSLVSTIVNLARSLKLKVVAEGVETGEQSGLLRLLGCDEMQGYLFSRPVPAADFAAAFLAVPGVAESAMHGSNWP